MTIVGIRKTPKPNFVHLNTKTPLNFAKGSISVSMNWEQHPTGSISITNIPEIQIDSFRSAYNVVGKSFVLFAETTRPIFFEIAAYAETEDSIWVDESFQIKVFDISVSLRGGHERKTSQNYKVKKPARDSFALLSSSRSRNFTEGNLINNEVSPLTQSLSVTSRGKISLKSLANKANIEYEGFSYAIEIPKDAGSDFELNFTSSLQEQLRLQEQMVDYHEPVVKTRDYRVGKTWSILNQDIVYSIELSKQQPYEYKDTVISGKDNLPFLSPSQIRQRTLKQLLAGQQNRKAPEKVVLLEGDEDPTSPPPDVKKLISIDMNFDFSGPRKTLKKTTTLNGQPFEEELFTYGLAYLAQQIRNPAWDDFDADIDTPPLLGSPSNYWQLIEYTKTSYIYKESDVRISIQAKDKETNRPLQVKYFGGKSFDSRYLTSIKTTGWKLARFQQEQFDESGSGAGELDSRIINDTLALTTDELEESYLRAQLKSISFRKVPYISTTQYRLVPATNYYEDEAPVPFNTQELEKKELGLKGSGTVVAAIPDPSFVYPMLVLEERTLTQSFAQMDHPQNIILRDEARSIKEDASLSNAEKEEDLKGIKLVPWLTTGEDTYQATLRKIIPSKNTSSKSVGKNKDLETDLYVEYEISASNQDAKFQYSLQEGTFRTVAGRPPSATNFTYEFEDEDDDDKDDTDPFNFEYLVDSTSDLSFPSAVESLQYETTSREEAIKAAEAELAINNFLNVYEDNVTLAWFYPEIRPGDYINFVDNITKGKLRVKGVSFQIDYQDHVNGIAHRTCSGTSLTLGKFEERNVTSRKKNKDETEDGLDIKSSVSGEDTFGISIYPTLRTRRNPDNQQVQ